MIKAHIVIHKSPTGKLSVECLDTNADVAISAIKTSKKAGELALYRLTSPVKSRKNRAAKKAAPSK